jgi:membrane associated rhomboid family serine protease
VLIPIGLDNARLSRWPRASTAIVVLCVLAFFGTLFSSAYQQANDARDEAVHYLLERPYLRAPEDLLRRLHVDPAQVTPDPVPEGVAADEVAREQERLEALSEAFAAAQDATPLFRYSVVRSHGILQPGWITYQFMHGGLGHLLGNLLIFVLLVGPFLEDAWGSLFFTGFYLLGGLVAAVSQLPWLGPDVPLLGASGAISACLGAFALRFAHRRVRMFYWWFLVLRGQFFVPAWLYALFGFGMDLLGLQLSGEGGGVAYACHVGGFLFGAAVAVVVRATRLEERLAPEGAVRWRDGLDLNRAAESLAEGDVAGARARLQDVVRRKPDDTGARLELARLEAGAFDLDAATEVLEPVLARRIGGGDVAGARALLSEFRGKLRAGHLRPATAYRVAELVENEDEPFALALYEVVGAAGGGLGVKALLKAAQRLSSREPDRARDLLDRAELASPDAAGRARIEALRAAIGPPQAGPGAGEGAAADRASGEPIRELWCRVTAAHGGALDLVTAQGRSARIEPGRVAQVSAALIERLRYAGQDRSNGVILDLLLKARPGEPRVLLRMAGHDMGLSALRPGIAPAQAFAELVEAILIEGGGSPWPDATRLQGRPFVRYPDLPAYERACFGRVLSVEPAARTG